MVLAVWIWGLTLTKHVWHQNGFAMKEAACKPGFEESGVFIGNEEIAFQAEGTEF